MERRRNDGGDAAAQADSGDDVRSMVTRLASRVGELSGALDQARRQVAELETQSDEDTLLPVLNRRGFMRELGRAIAFVDRYGTAAALVRVDIDGLKAVNQAYGHGAGDTVLREAAARLRAGVRASDVVGRLGGEALGIILWTASPANAGRKAEVLATALSGGPFAVAGLRLTVAASAGAAALQAGDSADAALTRAGAAVRHARGHGA